MVVFADSSFIVSVDLPDANTGRATAFLNSRSEPLYFSSLHALEIHNSISRGIFQKKITEAESALTRESLDQDRQNGRLIDQELNWSQILGIAISLSIQSTPQNGSRSLDVLHVATAIGLGVHEIVTFDHRQAQLAQAAGLKAITP